MIRSVRATAGTLALLTAVSACGGDGVTDPSPAPSPPPASLPPSPSPQAAVTVGPDVPTGRSRACPVTRVSDRPDALPPEVDRQMRARNSDPADWYGGGGLWVLLDTARYAYPQPDGKLGVKVPWWRVLDGPLTVDAVSPETGETVRGEVPGGYTVPGFQASGLVLPHLGCWHVTATLVATRVRYVVKVIRNPAPPKG